MICFLDRTFCASSADCANSKCWRNLSADGLDAAALAELPIAFADLKNSLDCPGYIAMETF